MEDALPEDTIVSDNEPITENQNPEPRWFIDEGVGGQGDRPAWFPEKFKTVKDAMNSLTELEKKLGTAPVNDYDFGEHAESFDKDHEAFKELTAFAKEKRVPQEVFTKMLDSVSKYAQSLIPSIEAEKAKLGQDADKRVEVLTNWVRANLSEKAADALTSNLVTADTILAMEEMRSKVMSNNVVPNGSVQNSAPTDTVASLQKEYQDNIGKIQTDSAYRADWQRRANLAAKQEGNYVEKTAS